MAAGDRRNQLHRPAGHTRSIERDFRRRQRYVELIRARAAARAGLDLAGGKYVIDQVDIGRRFHRQLDVGRRLGGGDRRREIDGGAGPRRQPPDFQVQPGHGYRVVRALVPIGHLRVDDVDSPQFELMRLCAGGLGRGRLDP